MERCHIDFFDFESHKFLLLVDAFSKWLEVWPMSSCTTGPVLDTLRSFFASAGFPALLCSDNGPPFDSHEYSFFCSANNIRALFSPPRHPASNGLGEICVGTCKKGLRKLIIQKRQLKDKFTLPQLLSSFLLHYRNTPSTATGQSPASLWLAFTPRTQLSFLNPNLPEPKSTKLSSVPFREGEKVHVRLSAKGPVVTGIVARHLSCTRYLVTIGGMQKEVSLNQLSLPPLRPNSPSSSPEESAVLPPVESESDTPRRSVRLRRPVPRLDL